MELRWVDGNLYRARFIAAAANVLYQVSSPLVPTPLEDLGWERAFGLALRAFRSLPASCQTFQGLWGGDRGGW